MNPDKSPRPIFAIPPAFVNRIIRTDIRHV